MSNGGGEGDSDLIFLLTVSEREDVRDPVDVADDEM